LARHNKNVTVNYQRVRKKHAGIIKV